MVKGGRTSGGALAEALIFRTVRQGESDAEVCPTVMTADPIGEAGMNPRWTMRVTTRHTNRNPCFDSFDREYRWKSGFSH